MTFFKIIFPLLKPATSSVVVLFTLQMWNDFTLPMIMLQSAEKKTITTTVYSFLFYEMGLCSDFSDFVSNPYDPVLPVYAEVSDQWYRSRISERLRYMRWECMNF